MTKMLIEPLPSSFGQIVARVARKPIPDEFSVVSLFSGCGGMDLGFSGGFNFLGKIYDRLPFRVTWANDIKVPACKTYKANLRHEIHCGDIWDELGKLPASADVLIGGFPCQDVSINGSLKGSSGVRTNL